MSSEDEKKEKLEYLEAVITNAGYSIEKFYQYLEQEKSIFIIINPIGGSSNTNSLTLEDLKLVILILKFLIESERI